MTTIVDYPGLQTAISTFTRRDDAAIDADMLIQLGEDELSTELRLSQMMTTATVTMTPALNYTALPTGFLELVTTEPPSLIFTDTSIIPILKSVGSIMNDQSLGITARPLAFGIGESFLWDRLPDVAYTMTCRYFKKWDIAATSTNWLLTNHPMLYVAFAMKWAAILYKNDKWLALWEGKAGALLKSVKDNDISARSKATLRADDALGVSYAFDIRTGL